MFLWRVRSLVTSLPTGICWVLACYILSDTHAISCHIFFTRSGFHSINHHSYIPVSSISKNPFTITLLRITCPKSPTSHHTLISGVTFVDERGLGLERLVWLGWFSTGLHGCLSDFVSLRPVVVDNKVPQLLRWWGRSVVCKISYQYPLKNTGICSAIVGIHGSEIFSRRTNNLSHPELFFG